MFSQLENVAAETTEDLLRLATGRFQLAMREGTSGLSDVLVAVQLLSRSRDPLARSAFLNVCAGGLVLSARYEEALRIAEQQVTEAQEYRLDLPSRTRTCVRREPSWGVERSESPIGT